MQFSSMIDKIKEYLKISEDTEEENSDEEEENEGYDYTPYSRSHFNTTIFDGMMALDMSCAQINPFIVEEADLSEQEEILLNNTQVLDERIRELNNDIEELNEGINDFKNQMSFSSKVQIVFTFVIASASILQLLMQLGFFS